MMGRLMLDPSYESDSLAPGSGPTNHNRSFEVFGHPGLPAANSRGGRQLFPLPHFACPPKKVGVSRTVAKRRNRIRHIAENCNQCVDSLNWLSGYSQPGSGCSGMQAMALARMDALVRSQEPRRKP